MADDRQLILLLEDSEKWNRWRQSHPKVRPNLAGADLSGAKLSCTDLTRAVLEGADLSECDLSEANLAGAILYRAKLVQADLTNAFLRWADLSRADLRGADLRGADLRRTHLTRTVFRDANLDDSKVYGIAAWNLDLEGSSQANLIITEESEAVITVDDVETAQFIYLILNNTKLRKIISSMTSKAVLVLGRFTPERKAVLDSLRAELRRRGFLPIVFDFESTPTRNLTETVSTLAHLARFVIADITDAKSIAQELQKIVPGLPSLPIQPVILAADKEYSMFKDLLDYPWVLQPYRYSSTDKLISSLNRKVILPVEKRAKEIERRRTELEQDLRTGGHT
jgi:hypothetical protein